MDNFPISNDTVIFTVTATVLIIVAILLIRKITKI